MAAPTACRIPLSLYLLALTVASAIAAGPPSCHAQTHQITTCGETVTTDAVLVQDLVCDTLGFEEVAIRVGASNLTLDLGGHAIFGNLLGIGVRAESVSGVTITNGTIDGFLSGLDLVSTSGATVDGVTIRNLEADDPDLFLTGMRVVRSQDTLVTSSVFELLPTAHKEAIVFTNGTATFDSIQVTGSSVGVNYGGTEDVVGGSRGSVVNSRFVGVTIGGILLQCTDTAWIAANEFVNNEIAVYGDALTFGRISGVTITGNEMSNGSMGVEFLGIIGSSILDNVLLDNGWIGISLNSNMECLGQPPGPQCFYSTGNTVSGNRALYNVVDLYHHELAVGNTWQSNICLTKQGAEIPECTGDPIFADGFEDGTTDAWSTVH